MAQIVLRRTESGWVNTRLRTQRTNNNWFEPLASLVMMCSEHLKSDPWGEVRQ